MGNALEVRMDVENYDLRAGPRCPRPAESRPGRFVPLIDTCLAALDRGRKAEATANLQQLIRLIGDFTDVTQPSRSRSIGATR
jgi:hypothetical protein